jgi:tetratricopeptide (TPR) repeat protein
VLESLPESRATLEQAVDVRLELRPVLTQLGEVRRTLERLREAETLAERLDDESRRSRVYALLTNLHAMCGELDEALSTGTHALALARRLGDLKLRILATTYLEVTCLYRGEYRRVVELATDNLSVLPADWIDEYLGMPAPPAGDDRGNLVISLAELGRFAEAAEHETEAIRLAERTRHAYTVAFTDRTAAMRHLLSGDWAGALSRLEHAIATLRTGNVPLPLPIVVASSAWALAQVGETSEALKRVREGEELLERQAARGLVGQSGWVYQTLGRASLLLGRLDEARRQADRAVECSSRHPGYAAYAQHLLGDIAIHPDRFDGKSGEAHYRAALAAAEQRGMRPLAAHCHLGLGKLYTRAGQAPPAWRHLTSAGAMYADMNMRFWLDVADSERRALPEPS